MAYEEMKRWGFEQKKRQFAKQGLVMTVGDDKLVSFVDLMWKVLKLIGLTV